MGFPNTSVIDTFNRADENPLANGWTKPTYGTFDALKIVSNVCVTSTQNANDNMAYWSKYNFLPDCEGYFTVAGTPGTDAFYILGLRYDNSGNGYKVDWDAGTSRVRVWRDDAGVRTQLGANITQSMATGDSLGMVMVGSNINIWYKASAGAWTQIGTRTDSTYKVGGRLQIGCWIFSGTTKGIDNVGAGNIFVNRKTLSPIGTRTGTRQMRCT